MISLQLALVETPFELEQARDLRRSVLCGELHWPRELVDDALDARARVFLASLGPKPLASARLMQRESKFQLELLAVLAPFRRQGVARRLLARMEAEAGSQGAKELEATVPEEKLIVFESLGFKFFESLGPFLRVRKILQ